MMSAGAGVAVGAGDVLQADDADRPAGLIDHREHLVEVPVEILLDQRVDGRVGGHGDHFAPHDAADRHAVQGAAQFRVGPRGAGGGVDEEADEHLPDALHEGAADDVEDAQPDQHDGEHRARCRGDARRPLEVLGEVPHGRPQYPPAVERKGGQQVEHRQDQVDEGEIADDGAELRFGPEGSDHQHEEHGRGQREAGDGAGDRHPELGRRGARLVVHLGHPAEDEQRDARDRQVEAPRHQGMAVFVEDDRGEQPGGPEDRHPQVACRVEPRQHPGEIARHQRPHQQDGEQEPRVVEPHLDAKEGEQRNPVGEHGLSCGLPPQLPLIERQSLTPVKRASETTSQGHPRAGPVPLLVALKGP
jgi:hypothetical protein